MIYFDIADSISGGIQEIQPGKFWSLCKMRGIADFGCKHDRRKWKPWKSILVTIWMPQAKLIGWLFWVMRYQCECENEKRSFCHPCIYFESQHFFKFWDFWKLCTFCHLQLLLQSPLFHLFVVWKCTLVVLWFHHSASLWQCTKLWFNFEVLSNTVWFAFFLLMLGLWPYQSFLPSATAVSQRSLAQLPSHVHDHSSGSKKE